MLARRVDIQNPTDRRQFWRTAEQVYKNDEHWIPPLKSDQRFVLDIERHPFYQHSTAAFFVVEVDGSPAGRVAILNNRSYRKYHACETGFFHLFECSDDPVAARLLFEKAFSWAREQGMNSLIGPRGFIQGEGAGILVGGFDQRLPMGLAYNRPYYDRLLAEQGFSKLTDYYSGILEGEYEFPERVARIAARIRERNGYVVKVLRSAEEMRALIPHVHRIYNAAFTAVPGYYPMTDEETRIMGKRILSLTKPELIKLVQKQDAIIGFMIAYPNIVPTLRKVRGRMLPFGWIRLLDAKRRSTWIDFNGVGILPEYQGTGANAVLYDEMWKTLSEGSYDHGMAVQIREENGRSLGDMETLGAVHTICHRLYQIALV